MEGMCAFVNEFVRWGRTAFWDSDGGVLEVDK